MSQPQPPPLIAAIERHCDRIIQSRWFENLILAVLMADVIILALEAVMSAEAALLTTLLNIILGLLILDSALRFGATLHRPQDYFRNRWNCFDLLILVGLLCLSDYGQYLVVLRLPRFWRMSRLLRGMGFLKFCLVTAQDIVKLAQRASRPNRPIEPHPPEQPIPKRDRSI